MYTVIGILICTFLGTVDYVALYAVWSGTIDDYFVVLYRTTQWDDKYRSKAEKRMRFGVSQYGFIMYVNMEPTQVLSSGSSRIHCVKQDPSMLLIYL